MTDVAGRRALPAGCKKARVHFSQPGKNNKDCFENNGLPETFDPWLQDRPCFLFMGPPSMIRGVLEILDAFDRAAEKHPDICLVCLFRPDSRLDNDLIVKKIDRMKHQKRVWPVLELVDETTLNAFLSHCFAFVKTFAMMPSEIQLAIIKDMAWGKPVIVANTEVTGKFSRPFGLAARAGRIKDLSDAMVKLADSKAVIPNSGDT